MAFPRGSPPLDWDLERRRHSLTFGSTSQTPSPQRSSQYVGNPQQTTGWNNPPPLPKNMQGMAAAWNLQQVNVEAWMDWPEARPDMDEWLALNRGDPIWGSNPDATIWAQIHANWHRTLFPPAGGSLLFTGAGEDPEGSTAPAGPLSATADELWQQTKTALAKKEQCIKKMHKELTKEEAAQQEMADYLCKKEKGKEPEHRRLIEPPQDYPIP
ncbi:hypothetical protein DFS33DRAFT_1378309 [Desarmillaria ectypa]|nr:hypothetical protein DFS33DRAFT_1378309 [Desarmillaria ectypa]